MNKHISILLIGFSVCANAQSLDQQVISASGGGLNWGNGTIDFTIGEPIVEAVTQSNVSLTQGFHQSTSAPTVLTIPDVFDPIISVYPNPSNNFIYLNTSDQGLDYRIISLDGKRLLNGQLNVGITQINLADYANGLYLVEIISADKGLKKVFKITKQ